MSTYCSWVGSSRLGHFVEVALAVLLRRLGGDGPLQVLLALRGVGEHIVGPHKPLVGLHRPPDDKVLALKRRQALGHSPGQLPHRAGHLPAVLGKVAPLQVHGVAAEQLVGALAGEHHLHVLPGVLGQEVQGDLRGVGQGLVQHVLDFRHRVEEFIGADLVGDVGHAHRLGELLGVGQLAVLLLRRSPRRRSSPFWCPC